MKNAAVALASLLVLSMSCPRRLRIEDRLRAPMWSVVRARPGATSAQDIASSQKTLATTTAPVFAAVMGWYSAGKTATMATNQHRQLPDRVPRCALRRRDSARPPHES